MPLAERLRQILPFAVAVYLAGSVGQLHATQSAFSVPRGFSMESVASGIKWHMLEIAKNEQSEMAFGSPGN
ncbi:hypothetical protein [Methylobacterium sp. AMS5]|uniref:hypothetical protein n=1 Tax=Methylobacterium sp. AMS5 TaxID=925818 RepID=UPI00074F9E28|nr:hypothetical protein [Methylobacterium sp. AMS5]AMB46703.1 hypothetical protein Y590_17355 [Methylobacterium sp. AMS5]